MGGKGKEGEKEEGEGWCPHVTYMHDAPDRRGLKATAGRW